MLQKVYADNRRNPKEKQIEIGDEVLIKQNKTTIKSLFDPTPFQVTKVKGSQVKAKRGGQIRTRSKSHLKLVKRRPIRLKPPW